jgi:hypothetical protein
MQKGICAPKRHHNSCIISICERKKKQNKKEFLNIKEAFSPKKITKYKQIVLS